MDIVEVTVAIIERGGRYLIGKRAAGKHKAGQWEFPGGKVEPGETAVECLKRELEEEFGVSATVGRRFFNWDFDYKTTVGPLKFYSFVCSLENGEFHLTAHDEVKWADAEELERTDLVAADRILAEKLKSIRSEI